MGTQETGEPGEWEQTDRSVGAEVKAWLERSSGDRLSHSDGSLPNTHRSQHYGTVFLEKKELYYKGNWFRYRRQGSQTCLLDPGSGQNLRGWGGISNLESDCLVLI